METIKQAMEVIREGIKSLPDDAKSDYKASAGDIFVDEAISNACGMVNGDAEKEALLSAYAVQEANRVVCTLWREQLLTEGLEKQYRALPTMKEMADQYNKFTADRKARLDAVMEQNKILADEDNELNIFKGVVNGMDKKESERRLKEFRAQQQAALGNK